MRILVAHNHYQQSGGEDQVFEAECTLLRENGHDVIRFTRHNDSVGELSSLGLFSTTLWSSGAYRDLLQIMRDQKVDVIHLHNTLPLISPAAYYAARREGVPVVQTLHNFRLMCPNALLYRDQRVCNECVAKAFPWPSIVHKCYRGSATASGAIALMLGIHRFMGTYRNCVDLFLVLSDFSRDKYIQAGFDPNQLVVKPNFVTSDPGLGARSGDYCLYVGRLSEEKGIRALLAEWQSLDHVGLKIAGDGPLRSIVEEAAKSSPQIEWVGRVPNSEVIALMKGARILVFPSACYENFPMTIAEAFATGLPVIAARIGSLETIITNGSTGILYDPDVQGDLAAKLRALLADDATADRISAGARQEYLNKYSGQANYERIIGAYELARQRNRARAAVRGSGD